MELCVAYAFVRWKKSENINSSEWVIDCLNFFFLFGYLLYTVWIFVGIAGGGGGGVFSFVKRVHLSVIKAAALMVKHCSKCVSPFDGSIYFISFFFFFEILTRFLVLKVAQFDSSSAE